MAVIVVVLGIAMAMVIPMLRGTDGSQLKAAAQLLAADIAFAQVDSVAHGDDPRVIVFDLAAGSYHIAASSTPATPINNPVGNQPYVTTFGTGRAHQLKAVTIQSVSVGGDNQLGFGIYGNTDQTTDATVTLAAGGHTMTVTIEASTGEATIGSIN